MGAGVEVRHPLVGPVHGERVLDQVVGADGEEGDVAGQGRGHDGRAGHLHHHPHGNVGIELDALLLELFLHIVEDHHGLAKLHGRRDEREHDPDGPQDRGPEHGSKLPLEKRKVLQAVADAPQAQERVALRLLGSGLGVLVGAQIERSERERLATEQFDRSLVCLDVVVLGRLAVAGEIEELRAVEPHPVAAVGQDRLDLVRELDVAHQLDDGAVNGD